MRGSSPRMTGQVVALLSAGRRVPLLHQAQHVIGIFRPPALRQHLHLDEAAIARGLRHAADGGDVDARRRPSCRGRRPGRWSAPASRRRGRRRCGPWRGPPAAPAPGPTRHGRHRAPRRCPCPAPRTGRAPGRACDSTLRSAQVIGCSGSSARVTPAARASGRMACSPSRTIARAPGRSFDPGGRPPQTMTRQAAPERVRLRDGAAVVLDRRGAAGGVGGGEHAAAAEAGHRQPGIADPPRRRRRRPWPAARRARARCRGCRAGRSPRCSRRGPSAPAP